MNTCQIHLSEKNVDPYSVIDTVNRFIHEPKCGHDFHSRLPDLIKEVRHKMNGGTVQKSSRLFRALIRKFPMAGPVPSAEIQEKIYPLLMADEFAIPKVDAIIPEGDFDRVLGRSIIFRAAQCYHVYKFLKHGEDPQKLAGECAVMRAWKEIKEVRWVLPEPVDVRAYRRFENIPSNGHEAFRSENSVVFHYKCQDEGLFHYPHEIEWPEEKFTQSRMNFIQAEMYLIRNGLVHITADLFHNEEDNRKYLPIALFLGFREAGRLHAWEKAVRYPNYRMAETSVCDLFDMHTFKQIMENPSLLSNDIPVKALSTLDIMMIAISRVLLVDILVLMLRRKNEGKIAFDDNAFIETLSCDLMAGFAQVIAQLGGVSFEKVLNFAEDCGFDWKMAARQLSFWMRPDGSSGYISYVNNLTVPDGIYSRCTKYTIELPGPDAEEGRRNWHPDIGYSKDRVHQDLGTFNGPMPATALEQILWLATTYGLALYADACFGKLETVQTIFRDFFEIPLPRCSHIDVYQRIVEIMPICRMNKESEVLKAVAKDADQDICMRKVDKAIDSMILDHPGDHHQLVAFMVEKYATLWTDSRKNRLAQAIAGSYCQLNFLSNRSVLEFLQSRSAEVDVAHWFLQSNFFDPQVYDHISLFLGDMKEAHFSRMSKICMLTAVSWTCCCEIPEALSRFFHYHRQYQHFVEKVRSHYREGASPKKIPFDFHPAMNCPGFDHQEHIRQLSDQTKTELAVFVLQGLIINYHLWDLITEERLDQMIGAFLSELCSGMAVDLTEEDYIFMIKRLGLCTDAHPQKVAATTRIMEQYVNDWEPVFIRALLKVIDQLEAPHLACEFIAACVESGERKDPQFLSIPDREGKIPLDYVPDSCDQIKLMVAPLTLMSKIKLLWSSFFQP